MAKDKDNANASTANFRSDDKPGAKTQADGKEREKPQARGEAKDAAKDVAKDTTNGDVRTPAQGAQPDATGTDDAAAIGPGQLNRNRKTNTERSEASKAGDEARPAERELPNLTFTAPRVTLDTRPATGAANLTSHLNDPAMRRSVNVHTGEGAQSAISPLARDSATPDHEDARLKQDAAAADARGRRKGMDPRGDVEAWHQAEENRQSDLPGSPRKDLPET